ncbi:DeoR family transcriptional regulator, partial [Bacillus sp. S34]|nr:DeoR family transcriptional regulator [Bacillus sp. S34]
DFAEREGISAMTVRRDLAELADRGLVRRVHGGAVRQRHGVLLA